MANTYPTVTIENKLNVPFVVYDAFKTGNEPPDDPAAYFGTLTQLTTIQPGASQPIIPIHGPASRYLAYGTDGGPIAHEITTGLKAMTFTVDHKDENRIASTKDFVNEIVSNPDGSLAKQFKPLLTGTKAASNVNAFFQNSPQYKDCTFVSYMLVIIDRARTAGQPANGATYSLSKLCDTLGGAWPPGFPDITITGITCQTVNDSLIVSGDVDLSSVTFNPLSAPFIRTILPSAKVHATFHFHYGLDLNALGMSIELDLPEVTIVPGLSLTNPTITLDISTLFRFVVFSIEATVPFNLFGTPFNTKVSLTIDNEEASAGIVIDGDHGPLLTPPVMKGVHFDEFGVGLGVFFEPPSYVLGVQGKLHIGDGGNVVALDDDTFAVVCRMEGDIPDPLFISFYIPKMRLTDIITIFTNSTVDIGLPLTLTDLSCHWAKQFMEVVVLPDGSLSQMGYGFSGKLDLFGISFYGDYNVDLNGLAANVASDPITLGPLKLTGNGAGVSMKFDANGSPIRNNQLATTKATRDAIAKATTRQIVAPGGPSLKITTSGSPFLSLGANVSLFDLVSNSLAATVDTGGISWEQDLGAVVKSTMRCKLSDFHNFTGNFSYGLDLSVPLPSIAGFSLGSIPLEAMFDATLGINVSASDPSLTIGGGFDFEGLRLSIGPYSIDAHTGKFGDVIDGLGKYILDHASDLFSSIIGDAGKWAALVQQGLIIGVTAVAAGLKTAFGKSAEEIATVMKSVGYGINEISSAMSSIFSASDINVALQGAGYAASEVQNAFESVGGTLGDFAHSTWDSVKNFFSSGC